jgi:hypothetical protein
MIGRWYALYEDKMSADSGLLAFFVWLLISVLLQFVSIFLCVPLVLLALLAPRGMHQSLNAYLFLLCFFAARVVICVIPAARVAENKRRGPGWLWGVGALAFGQLVLATIAALPPVADGAKK